MVVFHEGRNETKNADYTTMYSALDLYEKRLDHKYERNLTNLIIVHPTYSFKIAARFFAPFLSESLSDKITFVSTLAELEQHVEFELLRIPTFTLSREEETQGLSTSEVGAGLGLGNAAKVGG